MSTFQHVKLLLVDVFALSKDAFHIYIGFGCFVLTLLIWPRARASCLVLFPGFAVALVLEALDLRDDFATYGYGRWLASLHDVLNTMLIPLALYLMIRFGALLPRRDQR